MDGGQSGSDGGDKVDERETTIHKEIREIGDTLYKELGKRRNG